MRLESATGISGWHSAHLARRVRHLPGSGGPFCQCDGKAGGHQEPGPFPAAPVEDQRGNDAEPLASLLPDAGVGG